MPGHGGGIHVSVPHGTPRTAKVVICALAVVFGTTFLAMLLTAFGIVLISESLTDAGLYFSVVTFVIVWLLIRRYNIVGLAELRDSSGDALSFRVEIRPHQRVLRLLFFLTVATMLLFGFFPIADSIALKGIIGCVLALFALGLASFIFDSRQ